MHILVLMFFHNDGVQYMMFWSPKRDELSSACGQCMFSVPRRRGHVGARKKWGKVVSPSWRPAEVVRSSYWWQCKFSNGIWQVFIGWERELIFEWRTQNTLNSTRSLFYLWLHKTNTTCLIQTLWPAFLEKIILIFMGNFLHVAFKGMKMCDGCTNKEVCR